MSNSSTHLDGNVDVVGCEVVAVLGGEVIGSREGRSCEIM